MTQEKLLSLKAAAEYLGISQTRLKELTDHGIIPAYRIAGIYLRFRKNQLLKFKDQIIKIQSQYSKYKETRSSFDTKVPHSFGDSIKDFWYFYDFYIISIIIIIIILIFIFNWSI